MTQVFNWAKKAITGEDGGIIEERRLMVKRQSDAM
jgi:hypothetical protein